MKLREIFAEPKPDFAQTAATLAANGYELRIEPGPNAPYSVAMRLRRHREPKEIAIEVSTQYQDRALPMTVSLHRMIDTLAATE